MSPHAHLVIDTLRSYRRLCARQLASVLRIGIEDTYAALVELDALGLAWPQPTMSAVPGVGRARYWRART